MLVTSSCVQRVLAAYGAFQLKLLEAAGVYLTEAKERAAATAAVHDALVKDVVQLSGDSSKEETLHILQGSVGQLLHVKLQMQVISCSRVIAVAWLGVKPLGTYQQMSM